jgi:hypothetical protein
MDNLFIERLWHSRNSYSGYAQLDVLRQQIGAAEKSN